MIQWLISRLNTLVSGEWIVFIVSVLPVIELRGGILAGYALGLDWWDTFRTAVIGNMLPTPLILVLARPVFAYLKKTRFLAPLARWIEERSMRKSGQIKKWRALGLCLFVAAPLPGTGAWTGSLIAVLLDMRMRDAVPAIGLGVLAAGFIMSALSYGLLETIITKW
jgi:uncharacterized membrane protein